MSRGGRNPIVLLLAIVSGAIAFVLSLRMMSAPAPAVPVNAQESIVVAVRDINIGTTIRTADVDLMPLPPNTNTKMLYRETTQVVGKVVRKNIPKGEAIKKLDLLEEGDNLASLIPKGYRAMTIPVTLPGNVTEMLQIGNRVDVILTYEASRGELKSFTLIENARVIGVETPKTGPAASGFSKNLDITLAVTPEGAETLAFAMRRGTLNISIRSLDEEGTEKFFTLKDLFFPTEKDKTIDPKELLNLDQPRLPKDVVEIIRGVDKEQYAAEWPA